MFIQFLVLIDRIQDLELYGGFEFCFENRIKIILGIKLFESAHLGSNLFICRIK